LISLHYFNVQSGALLVTVFGLPDTVWRSWSWSWPKRLGLGKFLKCWSWSWSRNKSLGLGLEKKVLFTSLILSVNNLESFHLWLAITLAHRNRFWYFLTKMLPIK